MKRDRRRFQRINHRLRCEIHHEDRQCTGVVLDVAASGLFVSTNPAMLPPSGTPVRVVLRDAPGGDLTLLARIARAHVVRRELAADLRRGIGLELVTPPPEGYYALLQSLVDLE